MHAEQALPGAPTGEVWTRPYSVCTAQPGLTLGADLWGPRHSPLSLPPLVLWMARSGLP